MKRFFAGLIFLMFVFLLQPHPVLGAWGESVYPKEQEINADLIKVNDKVIIESTVKGDTFAAGSTVRSSGHITNDLLGLGWYIHHQGRVEGNARLVGRSVIIDGTVEKNLSILAEKQDFGEDSIVKGNLITVGSNISLNGKVEGKLIVRADSVTIGGDIGKDVEIYANSLTILPRANFRGAVTYFGPQKATVNSVAKFSSPLVYKPVYLQKTWQTVVARLASLLLLGLLVSVTLPKGMLSTAQKLIRNPRQNFMYGTILCLVLPFLILILAWLKPGRLSALILLVTIISLGLIVFYLAQVIWGTVLGRLLWSLAANKFAFPTLGPNLSVVLQTIVGTSLIGLVCQIPYLGIAIKLALLIGSIGFMLGLLLPEARWKTRINFGSRAKGLS